MYLVMSMTNNFLQRRIFQHFDLATENQTSLFWLLQFLGWGAYFIVSSLTLTLFYNELSFTYLAYNAVRAGLGMLLTWPLRIICAQVWSYSVIKRNLIVFSAGLILSVIWTLLSIEAYQSMTGQYIATTDYGGWIYSSIFIFISWVALYHGVKYYTLLQSEKQHVLKIEADKQHQRFKRSEAENQAKMAKLRFLSYQLNPHFLFNTLNSIYALIDTDTPEDAKKMVSQLSRFLRSSLKLGNDMLISLDKEIETLVRYLDIEKTRFGERLTLELDVEDDILDVHIPIFILQPLVENSIKHAIAQSLENGVIRVTGRRHDEYVVLTVEDSGKETVRASVSHSNKLGIGLKNTKERLSVIYDDDYQFTTSESDLGGFKVVIKLPLLAKELEHE